MTAWLLGIGAVWLIGIVAVVAFMYAASSPATPSPVSFTDEELDVWRASPPREFDWEATS